MMESLDTEPPPDHPKPKNQFGPQSKNLVSIIRDLKSVVRRTVGKSIPISHGNLDFTTTSSKTNPINAFRDTLSTIRKIGMNESL